MIELEGKTVCFTGKFSSGMKRDALFEYAKALGAKPKEKVTKTLDVLVIGGEGSALWVNPYVAGKKILKVEKWNKDGCEILIAYEAEFMATRH